MEPVCGPQVNRALYFDVPNENDLLQVFKYKYKYNESAALRTVQERRTTTIISQYARSNKTVLSRFLDTIMSDSVSVKTGLYT